MDSVVAGQIWNCCFPGNFLYCMLAVGLLSVFIIFFLIPQFEIVSAFHKLLLLFRPYQTAPNFLNY